MDMTECYQQMQNRNKAPQNSWELLQEDIYLQHMFQPVIELQEGNEAIYHANKTILLPIFLFFNVSFTSYHNNSRKTKPHPHPPHLVGILSCQHPQFRTGWHSIHLTKMRIIPLLSEFFFTNSPSIRADYSWFFGLSHLKERTISPL